MIFEIVLAIGALQLVRRLKKPSHMSWQGLRPSRSRAEVLGAQGEARAHAKLKETLDWLCGSNYCLLGGPLVIEHAPGTAFPTAEIDHLAVTPFGIFVFETKNWSGRIAPSTARGMLTRVGSDHRSEDRRSPIDQNRTKVAFFRSNLPCVWPVMGAGLFTSPEARLDAALHSDLLSLTDVPQWLRSRRDAYAGMPAVDVRKATAAVTQLVRTTEADLREHKRIVSA
ncbi:NERD domain protein [Paraburkholderia hospita]|uniref:NERD domain protein n=1 Tax=Paraburkholderia hospita TaxID=169430 RepID=A0ABN0FDM8_9BURK|nr:nuclease-related domain-containing protein [Paraburkholderia hospita]EIM96714.1 NERD domain protein [Paraburkholderia hospita]OUL87817.1 NERD nuclease [Paraburkholderia hospita]